MFVARMMYRHRCHGRFLVPSLLSAILAIVCGSAQASPIRYEFGGTINTADPSTGVSAGARFSGTFTYDPTSTSTPALAIEGLNQYVFGRSGSFPNSAADGSGLALRIGDQAVLPDPGGVQVSVSEIEYPGQWGYSDGNGRPAHPFTRVGISNGNIDGGPLRVYLQLANTTRSVFGSLASPAVLDLADFPQASLLVELLNNPGSTTLYTGTIDTLTPVPVPEPGTFAVFAVATGAAGLWLGRSATRRGVSRPD